MKITVRSSILLAPLALFCLLSRSVEAQTMPELPTPRDFTQRNSGNGLTISRETVAAKPVSVIGPRGALLGEQNGSYEAWIFPWKIFSGMRITANMQDYPVPIDVLDHSAQIEVTPDHTTITYSHANFTLRQIMLAPKQSPEGTGVLVLYQVQAIRPITLTFSFKPEMQRMWPAQSDDRPSPEWVSTAGGSGFYILHENFPGNAAALAMPSAEPGILAPYQERAHAWPLQFVLHVDPRRDRNKLFPLLISYGGSAKSATKEALAQSLATLDSSTESIYRANDTYYKKLISQHTGIETPDKHLDEAFSWAEVAIDQLRVQTIDRREEALTAGFVDSGDGARPGFGWFFGRDALWTLYAVNSYGDYDTTKREIEFLLHRQSPEGKIMHEWSQTADLVDWKSLPYEYAAADATPLLPMAMDDYLKISGDTDFIRAHWKEIEKAWQFESTHDSSDGIYNNGQGTGWVESWVPSMPQQEIYLAALDEQASLAFAHLAHTIGEDNLARQATQRAEKLRAQIEKEYFLPASNFYAFSHNADGSLDGTPSIFPTVAWWDGTYSLEHADTMFERWASSEFSTDWGTRLLSDRVSFYDPISYHQGSVWPLFTGWASVAEYRAGHPLSGYAHLMQNADLTWAQDLGSTTELLAGQFYQVLGRSTAHQLWSSAMVISPILRGMFGLEWDAAGHSLTITPHLPADWDTATLRRLPIGDSTVDLVFTRHGQGLVIEAQGSAATSLKLLSKTAGAKTEGTMLRIPLPPVEAAIEQHLPPFGDETKQMKVLREEYTARSFKLTLAAQASSVQTLMLRENAAGIDVHTEDAKVGPMENNLRKIKVEFPQGSGYVTKVVTFSW